MNTEKNRNAGVPASPSASSAVAVRSVADDGNQGLQPPNAPAHNSFLSDEEIASKAVAYRSSIKPDCNVPLEYSHADTDFIAGASFVRDQYERIILRHVHLMLTTRRWITSYRTLTGGGAAIDADLKALDAAIAKATEP